MLDTNPPVTVVIRSLGAGDSDLATTLPIIMAGLRQLGFNVQESGETSWRIEVSGAAGKCPTGESRYQLRLAAIVNGQSLPISQLSIDPCLGSDTEGLASQVVGFLFNPNSQLWPYYKSNRTLFYDSITRYFFTNRSNLEPTVAIRDTRRPGIRVLSPIIDSSSRAIKPVAKVPPSIPVTIIGEVSDPVNVARLTLNGKVIDIDRSGAFRPIVDMTGAKYDVLLEAFDVTGHLLNKLSFTLFPETIKPTVPSNEVAPEKRLALVIGNGAYEHVPRLGNPPNDANAMTTALKSLGFEVISVTNGSHAELVKKRNEFSNRLRDEKFTVGLFYYAGHGVQHNGLNYLVPIEMSPDGDPEADCLAVQGIINQMETANVRTNIVILDACRDDPFKKARSLGSAGEIEPGRIRAPKGTFIAFATSPGSTAADGGGNNGTYTAALLNHIQTPNLSISGIFQRVRNEVMEKTKDGQIPWESTSLTGDFYFRR